MSENDPRRKNPGESARGRRSASAEERVQGDSHAAPDPKIETSSPTLQDFLTALLSRAPADAVAWCAKFPGVPEKDKNAGWAGRTYRADEPPQVGPQDNAYYSVAAFKPNAERRAVASSYGTCVALFDDVGEGQGAKSSPANLRALFGEPSYRVETSPGNEQWGYLLDRPLTEKEHQTFEPLAQLRGDSSGNNARRYGRLPAGINGKPEYGSPSPQVRCTHWNPKRRVSAAELLRIAKANAAEPTQAKPAPASEDGVIPKGQRNETLFRLARKLNRYLIKAGVNEELRAAMVYNYLGQQAAPRCEEPVEERELRQIAYNAATAEHKTPVIADGELEFLALAVEEMLAPLREECYLIPGLVPQDAYTLIAGALASFKTFLLLHLAVQRATGVDLLDLTRLPTEPGPVVLLCYEDADWRLVNRLKRILQHGYREVQRTRGEDKAKKFLQLAGANLRRVPLTGRAGMTLVCRTPGGGVVRNDGLVKELLDGIRGFASSEVMVCLDPLRLAVVGSQNDDDGAETVVQTLNHIALEIPGSGVVLCSHTTKAQAKDSGTGYVDASYATAGSGLYSQHARSNLFLARMSPKEIRDTFDPNEVSADDADRQLVAKLAHGRLSHGAESKPNYIRMKDGSLWPIEPRGAVSVAAQLNRDLPVIIGAVERMTREGIRASAAALQRDPQVKALGSRSAIRELLELAEQNGYLTAEGSTSNRVCRVTEKGRSAFAGEVGG